MDKETPIIPKYRYGLKSTIIGAGFKSVSGFAKFLGVSPGLLGQIVGGWAIPGPKLQKTLASNLGLTLRQLRDLL